jgi:hypothetical protein
LPHIADLLVSDASEATQWAQAIVVSTSDPAYKAALAAVRPDQVVLDFANLKNADESSAKPKGFLW